MRCAGAVDGPDDRRRRAPPAPACRGRPAGEVAIDAAGVSALDTSGAWLLHRTVRELAARGCTARVDGLRPEFASLLELIAAREIPLASPAPPAPGRLERLGRHAWAARAAAAPATWRSSARARSRCCARCASRGGCAGGRSCTTCRRAGFDALPIIGLLSFLIGIVIAYQGADQLQRYGANIFVVDLVGARDAARALAAAHRHHRRRPLGLRLHGADRHDEGDRGDRRAAHHRHRAAGAARAAEDDRAGHRAAAAHRLHRRHGRARRHGDGARAARRQLRRVPRSPRRGDRACPRTGPASARRRCSR